MKVLMMVTNPELGGTETHVLYLARELIRLGIDVGVATSGGPFTPRFTQAGMAVHQIASLGEHRSEYSAAKVATIVQRHGYDLIHAHDGESFKLLPYLSQLSPDAGLVMTIHGKYVSSSTVKRSHLHADRVLAVSPALLAWAKETGVPVDKAVLVPNGIDTREFSPALRAKPFRRALHLPPSGALGLYVGRFQSDKVAIAKACIEAGERLAKRRSDFTMVLIGFGEYGRRLSREAKHANERLHRRAILVQEPTLDIAPFYHAATFVIGTGRVALEAMACGKPVIAAGFAGYDGIVTEGGLPSLLVHNFGDHGAKGGLHVSRLVEDMKTLASSPTYRRALGDFGRRTIVDRFSIEHSGERTSAVYRELMGVHRALRPHESTKGGSSSE